MAETFLHKEDDIEWLIETHLKGIEVPPGIKSALIHGNEDCPEKIEVWQSEDPLYDEAATAVYVLNADRKYDKAA